MTLLSRGMIQEIQSIADHYSEREAARLERADVAAENDAIVERVAEAISTKTYAVVRGTDDCGEWSECREPIRAIYRDAARAALAALRPT